MSIAHKVPGFGKIARENAKLLAENVDTLILDHHLLRSFSGYAWLKDLARESESNVLCAAAFMGKKPELLEAGRECLYNSNSASGSESGLKIQKLTENRKVD